MNAFRPLRSLLIALCAAAFSIAVRLPAAAADAVGISVEGEILDAATSQPLPARLTIRGSDGMWHFPRSASPAGSAVRYEKQRANTNAIERHTTLSAHAFRVELPEGRYTFTIER